MKSAAPEGGDAVYPSSNDSEIRPAARRGLWRFQVLQRHSSVKSPFGRSGAVAEAWGTLT